MSLYQKAAAIGSKYLGKGRMFKYGFNLSPMYRRTTARVVSVTEDLLHVRIRLPLNWKNRNYVNSIFGGSMFASVDPIPMVQLINLLDESFVVWDKSAEIAFKRPAREDLYVDFRYSPKELEDIRRRVGAEQEIEIVKTSLLTDKAGEVVFCEVHKTIYVADKAFYKAKRARRAAKDAETKPG